MNHQIDTELTIAKIFETSCSKFANHRAIGFFEEEDISYRELKKRVEELKKFIQDRGIIPGDRVAILGENSPNWVIAYFAITISGAIVVPILPDFHHTDIHHILRHSEAKALFVSERYYNKIEDFDSSRFLFLVLLDNLSLIEPGTKRSTLKNLLKEGENELRRIGSIALRKVGLINNEVKPDDIAAIIYTSGTTGHSKGVMLTHRNIATNAVAGSIIKPLGPSDRFISILPLAHVYECTIGMILTLMCGSSIYYLRKPPAASVLLPVLRKVRPTAILTVPLIIEKIYKQKIYPGLNNNWIIKKLIRWPMLRKKIYQAAGKKLLKTFGGELEFFGVGGAALLPEVEEFLIEAGFPYAVGYGLTETSPLIAGCNPKNQRFGSTGPVIQGAEVRIANPDPKTGIGEIQVRGLNVMKGYYRNEEATKNAFTSDGWFKTGDLGVFDNDGFLYIKGRLKNMILGPNGENIYPETIENLLNEHPLVLESLVYDEQGMIVGRVYLDYEKLDELFAVQKIDESQARQKIQEMLEELRKKTNEKLPRFSQISRLIEQREPFEKTPTQKIKRYLYTGTN